MRIHILSDLHLEFGPLPDYRAPDCDVIVLAGDIGTGTQGVEWAVKTFTQPVIYVPGNHEFWGLHKLRGHLVAMKEAAAGTNVHVINNEMVVIDGVRFIGATLWTDFNLEGSSVLALARTNLTRDSEKILIEGENGDESFQPHHMISEHNFSRFFLTEEMRKPFDGKTVVVTHHAPSSLSIHPKYERDLKNPAYASRLESIMLEFNPELWVHGHVHDNFDYEIGDTRVIVNPRGYDGYMLNEGFNPALVLDL